MNPLQRLFFQAAGGPSPPPPGSGIHSYNLGAFSYFSAAYPFLDMMKVSGPGWNGTFGPLNTDEWLTALPAGATALRNIILGMDPTYGYFPPGTWEIVSTSSAVLNMAPSAGLTVTATGAGRVAFTTTALPGAWDTMLLQLQVTNPSGSPIAFLDARFNKISDAAALAAGEIFVPAHTALYAGAKVLRNNDWIHLNVHGVAWARKFTELGSQNETRMTYVGDNGPRGTGTAPPSVFMKFAKKVGARPYIQVPTGGGQMWFKVTKATSRFSCVDQDGTTVMTHGLIANERVRIYTYGGGTIPGCAPLALDTTYFVVNPTSTDFQIALTSGGSPVTITAASNSIPSDNSYARISSLDIDPYTDMILPYLTAAHTGDPTAQPIVEPGIENWNTSFPTWDWLRSVVSVIAGVPGNAAAGHAWITLQVWKAAEALWGASNATVAYVAQGGYFAFFGDGFDYTDPGIRATGVTFKQQCITALAASPTVPRAVYAIASYLVNSGTTLADAYASVGSAAIPDAYWDSLFNAQIALRVTDIAGAGTLSDIPNVRLKVPGIPVMLYEWGQQVINSTNANTKAVGDNLIAYLDGAAGAAMYLRFWNAVMAPNNLYAACHYSGPTGRTCTTGQFYAWGISNGQSDSVRSTWFRTV